MFNSKPTKLGGTNDIFSRGYTLDDEVPAILLRPIDAMDVSDDDNTVPAWATLDVLNRNFSHYMGAGLVILKPIPPIKSNAEALHMIDRFRVWFTDADDDNDIPGRDKSTGMQFLHRRCYYQENEEYMEIPRAAALSLFGPSIWMPWACDVNVQGQMRLVPQGRVRRVSNEDLNLADGMPYTRWYNAQLDLITSKGWTWETHPQFESIRKRMADVDAQLDAYWASASERKREAARNKRQAKAEAKKEAAIAAAEKSGIASSSTTMAAAMVVKQRAKPSRITLDRMNPDRPLNDHLPRPLSDIIVLDSNVCMWADCPSNFKDWQTMPHLQAARPLAIRADFIPRKREHFDQLTVIAASVLQWRRAFLLGHGNLTLNGGEDDHVSRVVDWENVNERNKHVMQTYPQIMVTVPCGAGKTAMAACIANYACSDRFDHLTIADLNNPDCFTQDSPLRTNHKPERMMRVMFVVHNIGLMRQAAKSMSRMLPGIRIDFFLRSRRPNPASVDMCIASIDTIAAQDELDDRYLDAFPLVIFDEAHQTKSAFFAKAMRKFRTPYRLALTATPRSPFLPQFLGGMLCYIPQTIKMHVNMLMYAPSKQRPERKLKVRNKNGTTKADMQAEVCDMVLDMERNAWLTHWHMGTALFGKVHTHMHAPTSDELNHLVRNPLGKPDYLGMTMYALPDVYSHFQVKKAAASHKLSIAMHESRKVARPGASTTTENPVMTSMSPTKVAAVAAVTSNSLSVTTTTTAASGMDVSRASLAEEEANCGFFVPTAPMIAPLSVTSMDADDAHKEVCDNDIKYELRDVRKYLAGLPAPSAEQLAILKHGGRRLPDELMPVPYDPNGFAPCPIMMSQSIPQLIMHQHLHAQYWMSTCTSVPRQELILVRFNLRTIAVMDRRRLTPEQARQLFWMRRGRLHGEGLHMPDVTVRNNVLDLDTGISPAWTFDKCDVLNDKMHTFDVRFFDAWFTEWPMTPTTAEERIDGKPFRNKAASSTSAKKSGGGNAKITPKGKRGAETLPSIPPPELPSTKKPKLSATVVGEDSNPMSRLLARAGISPTSGRIITPQPQSHQPSPISGVMTTPKWHPGDFIYSQWMSISSAYWLPTVLPMPLLAKSKRNNSIIGKATATSSATKVWEKLTLEDVHDGETTIETTTNGDDNEADENGDTTREDNIPAGLWVPQTYEPSTVRSVKDWPILATFGLYIGLGNQSPLVPNVMPKCSELHSDEALDADFVYATHQVAGTGMDKPPLNQMTPGTDKSDDKQEVGRGLRECDGKQEPCKNEMMEERGCFSFMPKKHEESYACDKIRPCYGMIVPIHPSCRD